MKYLLLVFLVGCGSVEADRPLDGGADSAQPVQLDAAGGAGGHEADAAADTHTMPEVDAGTDAKPCVPSACIVCVNGVPTTPPGACM
jgi:hypothetical protein